VREIKKGEYITTLSQYYNDSGRTMEDIATCCNTTKQNISLAMKEAEAGTRRDVTLYIDRRSDAPTYAFTWCCIWV